MEKRLKLFYRYAGIGSESIMFVYASVKSRCILGSEIK
jgi:hypothetical protein